MKQNLLSIILICTTFFAVAQPASDTIIMHGSECEDIVYARTPYKDTLYANISQYIEISVSAYFFVKTDSIDANMYCHGTILNMSSVTLFVKFLSLNKTTTAIFMDRNAVKRIYYIDKITKRAIKKDVKALMTILPEICSTINELYAGKHFSARYILEFGSNNKAPIFAKNVESIGCDDLLIPVRPISMESPIK